MFGLWVCLLLWGSLWAGYSGYYLFSLCFVCVTVWFDYLVLLFIGYDCGHLWFAI